MDGTRIKKTAELTILLFTIFFRGMCMNFCGLIYKFLVIQLGFSVVNCKFFWFKIRIAYGTPKNMGVYPSLVCLRCGFGDFYFNHSFIPSQPNWVSS